MRALVLSIDEYRPCNEDNQLLNIKCGLSRASWMTSSAKSEFAQENHGRLKSLALFRAKLSCMKRVPAVVRSSVARHLERARWHQRKEEQAATSLSTADKNTRSTGSYKTVILDVRHRRRGGGAATREKPYSAISGSSSEVSARMMIDMGQMWPVPT